MTPSFELLQSCSTIADLRPLLKAVCMGFGSITRLDILMASQVGKRQALCFLRMNTPEEEENLIHDLGVGRFGGDIVVIVNLRDQEGEGEDSDRAGRGQNDHGAFQPTLPIASYSPSLSAGLSMRRRTVRSAGATRRFSAGPSDVLNGVVLAPTLA